MNLFEMGFVEVGPASGCYVVHGSRRIAARFADRTIKDLAVRAVHQVPNDMALKNVRVMQTFDLLWAIYDGREPPAGYPSALVPVTVGTERLIVAAARDSASTRSCHLFVCFADEFAGLDVPARRVWPETVDVDCGPG